MTLNARFPVSSDRVQLSTATAAGDTVQNGILVDGLGTVARVATAGGTQWQNGLLLTPTSQVVYVDAAAGLPAGTTWQNGLPLAPGGALCVSSGPIAVWQNGLPRVANGALAASIAGASDPFWANVVLLLQGSSLTDATGRHTLIVNEGTPTADGMLRFDGSSSLRIEDALADFQFPGAYTIEGQLQEAPPGNSTSVLVSNAYADGGWEVFARGAPDLSGGFYGDGGAFIEPATPPWVTSAVVDWAFVSDESGSALYLGGTRIGIGGASPQTALSALYLGREGPASAKNLIGGMRLRITKGIARMSGETYTPMTWPAPTNA